MVTYALQHQSKFDEPTYRNQSDVRPISTYVIHICHTKVISLVRHVADEAFVDDEGSAVF